MRLILRNRKETPPENGGLMGFRYVHRQDGYTSHALDEKSWLQDIEKHCRDNGYPPVDPADAIDQLCQSLPAGWCRYENGEMPQWFIDTRMTVRKVLNGTLALGRYLLVGMPIVSQELAESRSQTCSQCYFNIPTTGCAPCSDLAGVIDTIGGRIKTRFDPSLKSCAVCGCSTKAKTRMPLDLIMKSETEETLSHYPSFCWIPKENALDTEHNSP